MGLDIKDKQLKALLLSPFAAPVCVAFLWNVYCIRDIWSAPVASLKVFLVVLPSVVIIATIIGYLGIFIFARGVTKLLFATRKATASYFAASGAILGACFVIAYYGYLGFYAWLTIRAHPELLALYHATNLFSYLRASIHSDRPFFR